MRLILAFTLILAVVGQHYDWSAVTKSLTDAIKDEAFPGCTALVADKTGILYHEAFGHFTYGISPPENPGQNPPMRLDTRFDMASCTKVTTTTTAIAQFFQRGELSLDTPVTKYLPGFGVNGKAGITIRNCLLHNSGLYPDPRPFWNTPTFGCPQTSHYHPPENFECSEKTFASILSQSLQNPIGSVYVYSDLNFLTLMHVIGVLAKSTARIQYADLRHDCRDLKGQGITNQCYFEAYIRKYLFEEVGMTASGFGYADRKEWAKCAPATNDTTFLHSTFQGQVSDGNAYALGGIAGHAGLFSHTYDLYKFMHRVMFAPTSSKFMNASTAALFTREYNPKQSSRALGWNTNDPNVSDKGFNRSCGNLSPKTWMHTGYTGTMLCGDPERQLIVILLTNRVYPSDANIKIRVVRQIFSTAVQEAYDKGQAPFVLKLSNQKRKFNKKNQHVLHHEQTNFGGHH